MQTRELAPEWQKDAVSFPASADIAVSRTHWELWKTQLESCHDPALRDFAEAAHLLPVVRDGLNSVFGNSPFLSQNLLSAASLACRIFVDGPDDVISSTIRDVQDLSLLGQESRDSLMIRLRRAKRDIVTAAALANIGLKRPLMQITGWLSAFASAALQAACCHLLHEFHRRGQATFCHETDPAAGSGLIVLGMGKLGANELNFSSDIDIIILFLGGTESIPAGNHQRLFSQLARNLVTIMAKRTAEGYVFRTDLRLRPDPASTPPAVSADYAIHYYRTLAQTWERAAMIKARPVAGDLAAGAEFLHANSGFVWRRNLDFPALRDIQSIKRKINSHKVSGKIAVEGHNVKLGRGGIREIEFLTQTRQLIWGGQNRALRGRSTIDMLSELFHAGHITSQAAEQLKTAYCFLREIEHRIQLVNDMQTHSLPTDPEGIQRISTFMGFADSEQFCSSLLQTLKTVESHYNSMFEDTTGIAEDSQLDFVSESAAEATAILLNEMGFSDGRTVRDKVNNWLSGHIRATQTRRSQLILRDIADPLIRALASSPEPDRAFERFDTLLSRISRSINLFSTIAAEPGLIRLIADIVGMAPRLLEWISQQPALLEGVLQADFVQLDPSHDAILEPEFAEVTRRGLVRLFYENEFRPQEMALDLTARIETEAGQSPDLQNVLDVQRRWARDRKFQIGVHMLRGDMTPEQAFLPLCGIAETCLSNLMTYVKTGFSDLHGTIKDGQLAILACGRLGSREMTLSSDLDLIFVYRHAADAQHSDGPKSLAPTQYYAKLCRRFLSGVSAPTAEGRLYEVDMRLRPSGKSGPIACSIDRFEHYQRFDAWTWEHQALTRARVIYAEGDLGERLQSIITSVLTQKRARGKLVTDIRAMHKRIKDELENPAKPTIKYRRGGILDAEFIAQFLQLLHAAAHPVILQRDACHVFQQAGLLNLIDSHVSDELMHDLRFWRNMQGIMLLTAGGDSDDDIDAAAVQRTFGTRDKNFVLSTFVESIHETSERIAAHFDTIIR
ncbi:MAG: bifunctional [glutamate--ammonia ligase]-adenylyl-L-tyrosine phosphorylase/[glutamate--ammonia-ligase] adenylyltransferase [Rhodobacteraceae bacterium]|nr:bifunctional [glutamate--ammonia ligase]-adenylyl-L-tyrosine phosphorylase/[glutamate--ammonia-ligase] adenylyltransferase [Paracoccaceae bacterium]